MKCSTVSVDLSKTVFQISLADDRYHIVARKRLSRGQFDRFLHRQAPCCIVMEGCSSAHHWGRVASRCGHRVKLLHARYVRAYVRGNKTDSADADALIRAAQDRELKPIAVKSEDQQALQSLHRIREQWKCARTARINQARSLLAEFGVVLPRGAGGIVCRLHEACEVLPQSLHTTFIRLIEEITSLKARVVEIDRRLARFVANDETAQDLVAIDGVGITTATAALGRVPNIHGFRRGRSFAGWLGLTPREYSSGSTRRLGPITRAGDSYLRMLLIHGARAALLGAARKARNGKPLTRLECWALATRERVGHNKATVALANKMARIIWAVWTRNTPFNGNDALRFSITHPESALTTIDL